jgi:hypothetical protein
MCNRALCQGEDRISEGADAQSTKVTSSHCSVESAASIDRISRRTEKAVGFIQRLRCHSGFRGMRAAVAGAPQIGVRIPAHAGATDKVSILQAHGCFA